MQLGNHEIFRVIDGYLNYEVSNHGRVRNNKTGKILKPAINKRGYYQVSLCEDGTKTTEKIHKLVAKEFIENPDDLPVVDNSVSNLRYTTHSGNSRNKKMDIRNTSNVTGVCYDANIKAWSAYINDAVGTQIRKRFSIKKFPDAKQKAIEWRLEKVAELGYTNK